MTGNSPKFWNIFLIIGAIALVNYAFAMFVVHNNIMPVMPIPGSEPGKYDHYYSTRAPAFIQTLLAIWLLMTMIFSLPIVLVDLPLSGLQAQWPKMTQFLFWLMCVFFWSVVCWALSLVGRKITRWREQKKLRDGDLIKNHDQ